jgi:hypothetical protein
MRVLPIGLAIARSSGVLLVGIGLMVVVFASRQVNPWPKARVGAAIAAIGVGVFLVIRTVSPRYRQCPSREREILADTVKCPDCAAWFSVEAGAADP